MDPWHDYLALPIAPLVLVVQLVALFLPRRGARWAIEILCPLAITAMFLYVSSIETRPGEGVNIGEGILFLWTALSVALLVVTVLVEGIRLAIERQRAPRFTD